MAVNTFCERGQLSKCLKLIGTANVVHILSQTGTMHKKYPSLCHERHLHPGTNYLIYSFFAAAYHLLQKVPFPVSREAFSPQYKQPNLCFPACHLFYNQYQYFLNTKVPEPLPPI
ncbi:hypothetical protein Peur_014460 [Populus x canadensis]